MTDGDARPVWNVTRAVFVVKETASHSLDVLPLMFGAALVTTPLGQQVTYDDRWCYESVEAAMAAAQEWDPQVAAEPSGWHRHPQTGRRRPDGDAAREYVEH